MKRNEKGFHLIEICLVIVVVGAIGFVGWKVYDNNNSKSSDSSSQSTKKSTTSGSEATPLAADAIKTKDDLGKASDKLKSVEQAENDISSDLGQLN